MWFLYGKCSSLPSGSLYHCWALTVFNPRQCFMAGLQFGCVKLFCNQWVVYNFYHWLHRSLACFPRPLNIMSHSKRLTFINDAVTATQVCWWMASVTICVRWVLMDVFKSNLWPLVTTGLHIQMPKSCLPPSEKKKKLPLQSSTQLHAEIPVIILGRYEDLRPGFPLHTHTHAHTH